MKEIINEINEIIKKHDDDHLNNRACDNNTIDFRRLIYLVKKLNL